MANQRYETNISVAIHRHQWKSVKTFIMTKVFQTFFETTPKIFKQTSNNGATLDFIASIVKSINVYSNAGCLTRLNIFSYFDVFTNNNKLRYLYTFGGIDE